MSTHTNKNIQNMRKIVMKTYFANDITYLFDKKRQHDCIINIKQTHTQKTIFDLN